eukprot:scaffold5748_cov121-Chaetoceros_neogracile.AAC.1
MSNLGIGLQMTGSTIHQECYSVGPGPDYYKVKGSFKVSGREKKNQNKLLSRDTTGGTKSNFVMLDSIVNCEAGPCTEKLTVVFVATLAHLGHSNSSIEYTNATQMVLEQLSYFFCEELVEASLTGVCVRPSACSFSQNSFKGSSKIYLPLITPTTDPNKTLLSREALDRLNDGCETELHLNGIGWNRV